MRTRGKVLLGLGTAVALGLTPWALVNGTSYGHRYDTVAQTPYRPVALVLGAGLQPDGSPSPFLAQRLDVAVALVRAGKVGQVLVSGDHHTVEHDEVGAMALYLELHGVPPALVTEDHAGLDTYDSCWRAKHVFGVGAVTLVTQDYHLPRAVFLCRSLGLDAVGVGGSEWGRYPADMATYQARELVSDGKALVEGWVTHRDAQIGGPPVALSSR